MEERKRHVGRGEGKRRADLSLLFSQAPGNFLIDFQGYVSNLFFQIQGPCEWECESTFFKQFPLNSAWAQNVCIGSRWPPSPTSSFSSLCSSLSPWKEGRRWHLPKKKKKKSMCFQTGCVCWQHRSLATIKKFALPDRLFLFWTLHAVEWITGACLNVNLDRFSTCPKKWPMAH